MPTCSERIRHLASTSVTGTASSAPLPARRCGHSSKTPPLALCSRARGVANVRQLVEAGLQRAGFAAAAEVWCEAPVPLLRERFAQRWSSSHAIHGVAPDDDEWAQMIEHAEPLGLGPVLRVDTSESIDIASVVDWCHTHAWAQGYPSTGRR